ncbi:MAG: hypothetical protein Q9195_008110, partial [Heterodermia aff. obscurata]
MSSSNSMASILFKGENDEKPPHPVEPYGSRQLSQAKTQGISNAFLVGYFEHFAGIHGTDEVVAGKPQPQGPKKPIRPPPFDPYGGKKPSMAHDRQLPGSARAIDGTDHGASTKTLRFGKMVRTLAQLLDGHVTANKSTTG